MTQPVSMTDLLADLRVGLRSPSTSASKWTDAELYDCIKKVVAELSPLVWTEGLYELDITPGIHQYSLPAYIHRVQSVQAIGNWLSVLLPSGLVDEGTPVYLDDWQHDRTAETNTIRFVRVQRINRTARIRYLRQMEVLPTPSLLATAITPTTAVIDVASIVGYPVPGYLKVENEYLVYATVDTTAQNLTSVTRGLFNSVAVDHTAVLVDPVFAFPSGQLIRSVIVMGAQVHAHLMRLNDSANSDVSRVLTVLNLVKDEYLRAKKALIVYPGGTVPNRKPLRAIPRRFIR